VCLFTQTTKNNDNNYASQDRMSSLVSYGVLVGNKYFSFELRCMICEHHEHAGAQGKSKLVKSNWLKLNWTLSWCVSIRHTMVAVMFLESEISTQDCIIYILDLSPPFFVTPHHCCCTVFNESGKVSPRRHLKI
jgi:phosphopantetheinyl transferase